MAIVRRTVRFTRIWIDAGEYSGVIVNVREWHDDKPPEDVDVFLRDHELMADANVLRAAVALHGHVESLARVALEKRWAVEAEKGATT